MKTSWLIVGGIVAYVLYKRSQQTTPVSNGSVSTSPLDTVPNAVTQVLRDFTTALGSAGTHLGQQQSPKAGAYSPQPASLPGGKAYFTL